TGQGEFVGVTDAGGLDLDQHLTRAGPLKVDFHDLKGLACPNSNCRSCLHRWRTPLLGGDSIPTVCSTKHTVKSAKVTPTVKERGDGLYVVASSCGPGST